MTTVQMEIPKPEIQITTTKFEYFIIQYINTIENSGTNIFSQI